MQGCGGAQGAGGEGGREVGQCSERARGGRSCAASVVSSTIPVSEANPLRQGGQLQTATDVYSDEQQM